VHTPRGTSQQRAWFVDGLELDLYDIAVLGRDPTLASVVAAAELYQAGLIAVDGRRLVPKGPPPQGVHPVERAVYATILDGGTDQEGHAVLDATKDAPAVLAVRRRVGAELGLARPDAEQRFRYLSGLASGSAAIVAGVIASVWAVAQDGWWGVMGAITLAPFAVVAGLALGWLPYGLFGRLVRLTPRGRRVLRTLRAQRRDELRAFDRASRGGRLRPVRALSLGAAIALTGGRHKLPRWNKELDTALRPPPSGD
jgi:uncharacterized protein (TIGR04222 family)